MWVMTQLEGWTDQGCKPRDGILMFFPFSIQLPHNKCVYQKREKKWYLQYIFWKGKKLVINTFIFFQVRKTIFFIKYCFVYKWKPHNQKVWLFDGSFNNNTLLLGKDGKHLILFTTAMSSNVGIPAHDVLAVWPWVCSIVVTEVVVTC